MGHELSLLDGFITEVIENIFSIEISLVMFVEILEEGGVVGSDDRRVFGIDCPDSLCCVGSPIVHLRLLSGFGETIIPESLLLNVITLFNFLTN